jgi:hypothetical protein
MLIANPKFSTPFGHRMASAVKSEVKLKTETKHYISEACLFLSP